MEFDANNKGCELERSFEQGIGRAVKKSKSILSVVLCLLGIVAIAAIAFRNYWDGMHRFWDDYATIDAMGVGSWLEGGCKLTQQTYNSISRFQPVRLCAYSMAVHLVPEDATFAAIFVMHVINTILLFVLLRKFGVGDLLGFLAAIQFCIYAIPRHIYSLSNTIGGSGLCTLLILISVIALANGIQSSTWRRYAWLAVSWLAYAGMAYSYETAFPMILVVIFVWAAFFYFLPRESVFSKPGRIAFLVPYFAILASYIIFFYRGQSSYPGAQVSISADSLTRWCSYAKAMFARLNFWPVSLNALSVVAVAIFACVVILIIVLASRKRWSRHVMRLDARRHVMMILLGAIWYFGAVILLTINQWNSPTDVYWGHMYLVTPGMSIFLVGLLPLIVRWVKGRWRDIVVAGMIAAIMPLVSNEVKFHLNEGAAYQPQGRVWSTVRQDIKALVDPDKVDAVLIKNLLEPEGMTYCMVSSVDGALLEWFGFKKRITTGDNVVSCRDGKIIFAMPFSAYKFSERAGVKEVENSRTEILYYDSPTHHVWAYGDSIDVPLQKNLFQLRQVRLEYPCRIGPLEAIVRVPPDAAWLEVAMDSIDALDHPEKLYARINDEPVSQARRSGEKLYLDVSKFGGCKYLFLHLNDPDQPSWRNRLRSVNFVPSPAGDGVTFAKEENFADVQSEKLAQYNRMYWMNGKYPFFKADDNWKFYDASWRGAVASPATFTVKLPPPHSDTRRCSLVYYIFNFIGAPPVNIQVCLNGTKLENYVFRRVGESGDRRICSFPSSLIRPGLDNVVEFSFDVSPSNIGGKLPQFFVGTFGFEEGQEDPWPAFGQTVEYNSNASYVQFQHWYVAEKGFRWAKDTSGKVLVRCPPNEDKAKKVKLRIQGFGLGRQQVEVLFNGRQVGQSVWESKMPGDCQEFEIPPEVYKGGEFNEIEFRVPDAKRASEKDKRILGFAFQNLSLTVE